jgi:hypothetical protein
MILRLLAALGWERAVWPCRRARIYKWFWARSR